MQFRQLGDTGHFVAPMMLGTATFGGATEFFKSWGDTQISEAKELLKTSVDAGFNAFDTADCYSLGVAENILGEAMGGFRREDLFISTKTGMWMSDDPNDIGTSRVKIIKSVEASLKRLKTDYIDLFYLHCYDAKTPHLEALAALNDLVKMGKIRYFGISNYSAWHLMKMLSTADKYGLSRPCGHQAYYSLAARELENELMPLCVEEKVATLVWSPLSGAMLGGKITRTSQRTQDSRLSTTGAWDMDMERLFTITDAMEIVAHDTGHSFAQIALAWLLARPSVASLVIGARTPTQLKENLKAADITLDSTHIELLDRASQTKLPYPYWHQRMTVDNRDPYPVKRY